MAEKSETKKGTISRQSPCYTFTINKRSINIFIQNSFCLNLTFCN